MNKAQAMRHAHLLVARVVQSFMGGGPLGCPAHEGPGVDGCEDCERVADAIDVLTSRHFEASGVDFTAIEVRG